MALRDYIVNNFWWKLLSLLLAWLTWLTISTSLERNEKKREALQNSPVVTTSTSRRSFPLVPITLLTGPDNLNRFRTTPAAVSLELGGESNELQRLQPRDVQAFVDVTDAGEERQFRRPIQVQIPRDVSIISLNPTNAGVERINPTNR